LDAAVDGALECGFDALTTPERLALLERAEKVRRRLPALEHPLINQLARQATPEELGGKLSHAIAQWALISRAEANRRVPEASPLLRGPKGTSRRPAEVRIADAVGVVCGRPRPPYLGHHRGNGILTGGAPGAEQLRTVIGDCHTAALALGKDAAVGGPAACGAASASLGAVARLPAGDTVDRSE